MVKTYLKKSITNLFHLGFVQMTNLILQLILIPLVVSRVGLVANGMVLTTLSIAGVGGILINFATNQTLPLHVKHFLENGDLTSISFKEVYAVRFAVFMILIILIFCTAFFAKGYSFYILSIIALLFSEVVNPYPVLLGLQKLSGYNIGNTIARFLAFALVYMFVHNVSDAPFVNIYLGLTQSIIFVGLLIRIFFKKELIWGDFKLKRVVLFLKENISLTISNLIVHFQQSFFLYTLGLYGNGIVFGAYAIIDKMIWGFRMLLVAFSNSIYPSAIEIHKQGLNRWIKFRKHINVFMLFVLIFSGILMFVFSELFANWLAPSNSSFLVGYYIKCISPLPTIIGLNLMNVMELVIESRYKSQMKLSVVLIIATIVSSLLFTYYASQKYIIFYLLFIETFCLVLYEKNRHYSA